MTDCPLKCAVNESIFHYFISRCEVRPGPKFVTRYFKIFSNSTWNARFHHYTDYQCTKPSFTLLFKGFFKMSNRASTSKFLGATEANFNYSSITIYPHTADVERNILSVSKRSCPRTLRNINTVPGIGVYSAQPQVFSKRTCRTSFGISRYELSVVKKDTLGKKTSDYDLLYFGEVQTGRSRRKYNPKSYQLPLKRYNVPNCTVCRTIRGSTAVHPPTFPKIRPRPVLLDDAWGSWTCETRPGSFLTRYMVFYYKKRHWEGYFNYFKDPYCKKLMFTLYGKGVFSGGSRSTKVKGGEDYVFTLTDASITPYDRTTTRELNSISRNNECGKDGEWVRGEAMDITQSKGCRLYGISLPNTQYDLLKMDFNENGDRELYVGQEPSDNTSPTSPALRPTSYQIPMLKCTAFTNDFIPPTPEPTKKPSTRYPKPPIINPILTVPTLKRKGDKTTPKRKGKTSKGTKGSDALGGGVEFAKGGNARTCQSNLFSFIALILMVKMLWN